MAADNLTAIYRSHPAARKLFDWVRHSGVENKRTTVEELTDECGVARRHSIIVLRALAKAGYGEFKIGRKGHPSRIEWSEDPRALAERVLGGDEATSDDEAEDAAADDSAADDAAAEDAAADAAAADDDAADDDAADEDDDSDEDELIEVFTLGARGADDPGLIEHSYVLRPSLRIVVDLPADLSVREAAVLGEWLRNLSFER